jgi:glutamine synthetase
MVTLSEVQAKLEEDEIEFILVQFCDIHGATKVKMVPVQELGEMVTGGAGFAGAAVWGMGQGPHSHDMLARVDLETYTPLSWMPNTARFAANLFVDGEPHLFCPRTNLIRVLDEVRSQGYEFMIGMEPEHFLTVRDADGTLRVWDPESVDTLAKPCYDFRSMAPAMAYLQELTSSLNALGWGVYQTDHEDANGQFEVNFKFEAALTTADRITFFKMAASQIAKKYGAIATFMPKPFANRTGSGLHVHFNLADARTRENVFADPSDDRGLGLSELAYHFLGGVLRHARALVAVTSPTINCYKRLQLGEGLHSSESGYTWTPAFISYGDNNRTQMIRTPPGGHCEDRTVSSAANPYLALAVYLAAGMDGVKNSIDPGEPNLGNLYARSLEDLRTSGVEILPQSLAESLDALEGDEVVMGGLGVIADEFIALKRRESGSFDAQVTPWEIERYLTFF